MQIVSLGFKIMKNKNHQTFFQQVISLHLKRPRPTVLLHIYLASYVYNKMLDKYIEVYYDCHRFRYWVQIECLLSFTYQILSHTFFDIIGTVGMFKIIGDLEKSFINSIFILRRKKS